MDAGRPFESPRWPGWKFQLRPLGGLNKHYARAVARVAAEPANAALIARVTADDYATTEADQVAHEAMDRASYAEGCIADWLVTDSKGALLPFSRPAARMLLDAIPGLFEDLRAFSRNAANFPVPSAGTAAAIVSGNSPPALIS